MLRDYKSDFGRKKYCQWGFHSWAGNKSLAHRTLMHAGSMLESTGQYFRASDRAYSSRTTKKSSRQLA